MKFQDKIVLITGGGTGVGEAAAAAFAAEGAQVVITGRRAEKLAQVCQAITGAKPVRYFAADMAERSQVAALVEWVNAELGSVDILVSNAGVNVRERKLADLALEDWDYIMNVNATGAYNIVHALLPQMRARQDGVIISVSSIAGIRPSILAGAAYSASKHAMTALTKVISLEEKNNGIRATAIHPGEINTPILDERPVKLSDEHKANILQPEDVAAAILFVASLPPRAHVPELTIKPTNAAFA